MKGFVLAFRFLTIFPLPKVTDEAKHFGQAMMFFPLVGSILGAILLAVHLLAQSLHVVFSVEAQALLILVTLTVLTRGLHLDGFADVVDGFWGGHSREERLRIMKDSHVGAFGVVALVFLLLGKYLVLRRILEGADPLPILLIFPVMSRWGMTLTCFRATDPRPEAGLAKAFVESFTWPQFVVATLFTVFFCAFLVGGLTLCLLALGTVVVGSMRLLATRKVGGVTGDLCGATGELTELFVLHLCHALR